MWNSTKAVALSLAVLHHGFSNFAQGSVPPGYHTVLTTADNFEAYLQGEARRPKP